jgi:glyoxylase-like metal-dependent hydrolase (beta-lactamase superfamily II)
MILNDHSDHAVCLLQIHLGGDRNFCYLLGERATGEAAAVDPGFAPEQLAQIASEQGLNLKFILLTHGHSDHTGGAGRLAALTGATIHAGAEEQVAGAVPVADEDRFDLGQRQILAWHTPGHAPGHMVYHWEGSLLTGDLLFCGKVGGTGMFFAGSSAEAEWASLHRVLTLPDKTLVFPGHDYYGGPGSRPHSTIGHERQHNPFLLCPDFEAFCALKENWLAYKEEHGIR